ncbi:MAG TPA: gamma-glutamyl-gamma-aminobutyrate hydrolase family protein [Planctomycetes bacterium]|nr:gamma-glutamyl-gamma-aminobutyrate hydrolase family protein [Planctomycetota bacterium]
MTMVSIGITTYDRDKDGRYSVSGNYLDAVRAAGGVPILLAPGEAAWESLLTKIDGLLLAGGGDVNPDRYGSSGHAEVYGVDQERDAFEFQLVPWAIDRKLPLFGICRGAQVINVALGGTLIEHLPDVLGVEDTHRLPARQAVDHAIELTPASRLAEFYQQTTFSAASSHHQAVRDVAAALTIAGRAPDGTIEALEMAEHPGLIAVQWHPEMTAAKDPLQQRLFSAFIEICREHRQD